MSGDDTMPGPLPERVRQRVLALAADGLATLPDDEVPGPLRPFKRFTPNRRARLAATPLAVALEQDPEFRERIAARLREGLPELAAAVDDGAAPAAADPSDVGAAAYLLRPAGWVRLVTSVGEEASPRSPNGSAPALEAVTRLQEQLAAVRSQGRAELDRVRGDADAARREAAELRRGLREARETARRAEAAERAATQALEQARAQVSAAAARAEAEQRRLRARLQAAETALDEAQRAARRSARESRALTDARARLLLDTVVDAAAGLRRELALPPPAVRPADLVDAAAPASPGVGDVAARALALDDPALLDQLLALPNTHLVVDGYNVTKSGYGGLPLEAQRARLVSGLASLWARTGVEITCCFDGAEVAGPVALARPKGVRVLFSRVGETADELIRRLVEAEPPGRPVVVVSSDRELVEGVQRAGARAVPAAGLLRRLERS